MINRKRALPLSFLVVGLLVALAGIAVVAGLWSKNLVIHGTAETGDVNADWFNVICVDQHNWNDGNGPFQLGEYLGKDVGWTDVEINADDQQIVDLTIHNGYPSYLTSCSLDWVNTGSIPVNEAGFAIVPASGGDPLTNCISTPLGGSPPGVQMNCDQLTVVFIDGVGQVDPCNPPNVNCAAEHSLYIHVEQPADQSDCTASGTGSPWQIDQGSLDCDPATLVDYHFQVKLCVNQWNEAATYEQCIQSPQHEGPTTDRIIDADGTVTRGDGLGTCGLPATPGSLEVLPGDPLTSWPTGSSNVGIDWFDKGTPGNGVFDTGCAGDDLHSESPGSCPAAIRDGKHDLGLDCKILDHNNDLANGEGVECDLETGALNPNGWSTDGVACPPTNGLAFYDANGSGFYDDGEDIVLDVNNDGVFD